MAIVRQPEDSTLRELNSPIVILNSIIDSENIGSIVRNCAAFGIDSLICDRYSASPYLRRAVRVSMGTICSMKVHRSESLSETIQELKNLNYKIIAAELDDKSISIHDFKFPSNCGIIFGSENKGILPDILAQCDYILSIPITDRIESLNVAASSAVVLYEATKKKQC